MKIRRLTWGIALATALLLLLGLYLLRAADNRKLRSFSEDPTLFPEELFSLFQDSKANKKAQEAEVATFANIWLAPRVSDSARLEVLELSNVMLRTVRQDPEYFAQWHTILDHYLRDSIRSVEYPLLLNMLRHVLALPRSAASEQRRYIHEFWHFLQEGELRRTNNHRWRVAPAQMQVSFEPELHYDFKGVDLICQRDQDSIAIAKTSGTYYPLRSEWVGREGKVYWTRHNFAPANVNVTLASYKLQTTESAYVADSGLFWHND